MKFRNVAPQGLPLSFDIDDTHYAVEPGATFDVPDHVAFAVKKMGVLAVEVGSDADLEAATRPDPAPVVATESDSPPSKKSR